MINSSSDKQCLLSTLKGMPRPDRIGWNAEFRLKGLLNSFGKFCKLILIIRIPRGEL